MLRSGFVELSCVVCIMTELDFNKVDGLFLAFLGLLEISVMSGREVCRHV